jgi:hypothetical protein
VAQAERIARFLIMDLSHSSNRKVLAYLAARNPNAPQWSPYRSGPGVYLYSGSHPDVVERVWDQLGQAVDPDSRVIVCGTPALVHPGSGVILAFALGTQYCLRLPPELIQAAIQAGVRTRMVWSKNHATDAQQEFGEDWIFGRFLKDELDWCREAYLIYRAEAPE